LPPQFKCRPNDYPEPGTHTSFKRIPVSCLYSRSSAIPTDRRIAATSCTKRPRSPAHRHLSDPVGSISIPSAEANNPAGPKTYKKLYVMHDSAPPPPVQPGHYLPKAFAGTSPHRNPGHPRLISRKQAASYAGTLEPMYWHGRSGSRWADLSRLQTQTASARLLASETISRRCVACCRHPEIKLTLAHGSLLFWQARDFRYFPISTPEGPQ